LGKKVLSILVGLTLLMILIPAYIVWEEKIDFYKKNEDKQTDYIINVKLANKEIKEINIEEYLIGVVAAEMPASFELEALKAQAVSARTYTLKRSLKYGGTRNKDHPEADVCTDPSHCQAWISKTQMRKNWGWLNYYKYYRKIKKAVNDTKGVVLVYNNQLIDPVYHSSCGGRTEEPSEVWKNKVPYLESIECTWEGTNRYSNLETKYTLEQLSKMLSMDHEESLRFKLKPEIRASRYTSSGRVGGLIIGSKVLSSLELRTILKLKSSKITWEIKSKSVVFRSSGNGHGVGLCQYGSNGLANNNKDYKTILKTYYQGISIMNIKDFLK
jgi:stage II sporulation protein D